MSKFTYEVKGEYNDWVELKKENVILHYGSVFSLITCINSKLVSRLNYGTDKYYTSEFKKIGDLIITVPVEEDFSEKSMYTPLVLTIEEFETLVEVSFLDRELLKNIKEATADDIENVIMYNFKNEFNVGMKIMSFDEILENIIAFSNYDEEIKNSLEKRNGHEILISKLQNDTWIDITVYIDIENSVYEWESIVFKEDEFYFRIIDDYIIKI